MCADASASTVSGPGCEPAPDVRSSSDVVTKVASDSARSRGYVSLRGRESFSKIYQEGTRRRRGGIVVVTAPGAPGPPQVGFVAGRRVGIAVRRNRARRRLRAAMEQVTGAQGTAYVVIAGPEVVDAEFSRVVGWLKAAMASGRSETDEEDA